MSKIMQAIIIATGLVATALPAAAAQCGNAAPGFSGGVKEFKTQAAANGIKPAAIEKALSDISYNRATMDRKSTRLNSSHQYAARMPPSASNKKKTQATKQQS